MVQDCQVQIVGMAMLSKRIWPGVFGVGVFIKSMLEVWLHHGVLQKRGFGAAVGWFDEVEGDGGLNQGSGLVLADTEAGLDE